MPPSPNNKSKLGWIAPVIIGLAVIGFADAAFLSVEHYRGAVIPCTITSGCQAVTTSRYATIGPVPIALLGGLYYLAVIIAAGLAIEDKRQIWMKRLPWLTVMGFAFSLYLVGLQVFVIKAYCLYCLMSASVSTLIFFISLGGRRMARPPKM